MSGTITDPFQLPCTWVLSIPDGALTASGAPEPIPAGDVLTATSSVPAELNAVDGFMDDGTTPATIVNALVFDPSVAPPTVYTVTLTDVAGLTPSVLAFQLIADNLPTSLLQSLPGATHTIQAVPPLPVAPVVPPAPAPAPAP